MHRRDLHPRLTDSARNLILAFLVLCLVLSLPSIYQERDSAISSVSAQSPPPQYNDHYGFVQFHLPNGSSQPWAITSDPSSGLLWFVEQGSNQIGSFNPSNDVFSEYNLSTPNSLPENLAIDPTGNIWITELTYGQLGELLVKNGTLRQFNIPHGPDNLSCGPVGVTATINGDIWLTCEFSNQIDEFFPSNSTFHQYDLPIFYSAPLQIVFDKKGNFWFSAADSDMIGYVTTANLENGTSSGINEFSPANDSFVTTITDPQVPGGRLISSLSTPSQIALSSAGNTLWITEHTASSFDRYNIQSNTIVKYWTTQTHNANYRDSLPNGIAIDSSGNIWIAEHYANKIALFDPVTEHLMEFPIPCCSTGIAGTLYLALGQNNTVWFTEFFGNTIGELKPMSNVDTGISFSPVDQNSMSMIYNMTANGNLSIPISYREAATLPGQTTLDFDISGISPSGSLENLTANFEPSSATISTGEGSVKLYLQASGLASGSHYLTVSARDLMDNVSYSFILKLVVTGSPNQFRGLLTEAAVVGVSASFIIVVSLFLFLHSRKARSSRRKKPKS